MSKYLNPFYLLIVSLLLALSLFIAQMVKKSTLTEVAAEQNALKMRIETIVDLKRDYADAKSKQREFLRLVNHNRIKASVTAKDVKNNQASLSLNGLSGASAKWVVEQLVNDGYRIRKLFLEHSDKGIDIKAEVLF